MNDFKAHDIAIIGMSGRFPEAENLQQFWANLVSGRDSVRNYPESRLEEIKNIAGEMPEMELIKGGYVDRITYFEPEIFSINKVECRYIDPQQRLLLELVEEAILDAGYNPDHLSGQGIGLFMAANNNQYTSNFTDSAMSFTNTVASSNVGRVAYTYNFTGPAISLDTACSSALIALYYACQSIRSGVIDQSIVGATKLNIFPMEKEVLNSIPVLSPSQRVRPFDQDADGTILGEGGGVLFLKRLSKAIEDGDHIHGVIKGIAVNSDGSRSNGMNAPSEDGQADVILKAIADAQIDSTTISYIETHGTGTKLGDPIEIAGINSALKELELPKNSVAIGSIKSNIGHLDQSAAIAGLLKVILALKNKVIPASLHFDTPNPLINFIDSYVYVNHQTRDWETTAERRRAGLTSLGLIGTNGHVILEEYSDQRKDKARETSEIITLSARTKKSLEVMIDHLASYLKNNQEISLNDLAFTLNTGRRVLTHKLSTRASSSTDLVARLEAGDYHLYQRSSGEELSTIAIFPDFYDPAPDTFQDLELNNPVFKGIYKDCLEKVTNQSLLENSEINFGLKLYCYAKLLETYSVPRKAVLGFGRGEIVADLVRNKITLEECVEKIHQYALEKIQIQEARLAKTIDAILKAGINTFILVGLEDSLVKTYEKILKEKGNNRLISFDLSQSTFLDNMIDLIKNGLEVDWSRVYQRCKTRRISLPGYSFDRSSYYLKMKNPLHSQGVANLPEEIKPETKIEVLDETTIRNNVIQLIKDLSVDEEFDLSMNFHDLGLDSIDVTHLAGQIKKDYNTDIPLSIFFEKETVGEIVVYLTELINNHPKENSLIQPLPKQDYYPASSAQKRIYTLKTLQGDSTAYNMFGAMRIEGELDLERVKRVIKELVNRHEAFRTSFDLVDGQVVQRIADQIDLNISYQQTIEAKLSEICEKFVQPFDLCIAPLLRVGLVKYGADQHTLMFDMHHIISDGTSMGILTQEFVQLYLGQELQPLTIQYKDFAGWQHALFNSEKIKEQEEYWLSQFTEEIPVLNLPTDYQRPAQPTYQGDKVDFVIAQDLTDKLSELNRQIGTTSYMVLLAAYNILLSKYSGQKDILVGSPIAGRRHADLQNIIGVFINTLVMRNRPTGEKSVKEFLQEVKERSVKAFDHQDYQFEKLVEKLDLPRDTKRNPIFDVMFVMQNMVDGTEIKVEDLKFQSYNLRNQDAKVDLNLMTAPIQNGISCSFRFSADLFTKETIERMSKHYVNILRQIVDHSEMKLEQIQMVSEQEKNQLLNDFNDTETGVLEDKTIVQVLEEQVEKTPGRIALVDQDRQLTYRALNQKANQLARHLRAKGVNSNTVVGIVAEPSCEMFIGIYAALKAGGSYLPIDPNFPQERIEFMLQDSNTKLVLTSFKLQEDIRGEFEILDLTDQTLYRGNDHNLEPINSSKDLVYIIYTSGTTGQPKGVQLTHRGLVNYIRWFTKQAHVTDQDEGILLSSFCFDLSYTTIYPLLVNGGKLHLVSKEIYSDPVKILDYLENNRLTYIKVTPSYFSMIVNAGAFSRGSQLASLRLVVLGGEEINLTDIERFHRKYPETSFMNHYGPTEATIGCIFKKIDFAELDAFKERPVIGKPIDNMKVYILNEELDVLPIGVIGEIHISGPGVARGYLNRDQVTAKKFISVPYIDDQARVVYKTGDLGRYLPGGDIEFLGRKDHQVKIRGYRVEVSEIEKILLSHESISDVIVLVKQAANNEKQLVAYFVAGESLAVPELRAFMLQKVPVYMIPTFFVQLDAMPLTLNGKIDRDVLPDPVGNIVTGVEYKAPETEIEEKMVAVISEVLDNPKVGVNDNFFSLGGNSLSAINAVAKMNEYNWNITVQDLFEYPTVKELADQVSENLETDVANEITNIEFARVPVLTKKISQERVELKKVLLTGVTGYLGIHLLADLLENTAAQIYCLVRGETQDEARERLSKLLEFYFGEQVLGQIDQRIMILKGDIAEEKLGLSEPDYRILAKEIDSIIHTAALVKHFGHYSEFERVNVLGTKRVINLAKESYALLNYISTMSVSGTVVTGEKEVEFTEENLYIGQNFADNVYVRSKFEAENLILKELDHGLQANIFRVGNLTGRLQDGHFQKNIGDSRFYNMIKTMIEIGGISQEIADVSREFTPIDLCSHAIIKILTKNAVNRIFHIYNHNLVRIQNVVEVCQKLGYEIAILDEVKFNQYVAVAREDEAKFNLLARLTAYARPQGNAEAESSVRVSSKITTDYLGETGFEWPVLNESYLTKVIRYMKKVRFIS